MMFGALTERMTRFRRFHWRRAGIALFLAIFPVAAISQLHGVVFNQTQSVTAGRVEEALTTLFYTGDHLVNGNLVISVDRPAPTGGAILFRYDGKLIGRITENRRWITRESIERFAGQLYQKIRLIDQKKRQAVLERLKRSSSVSRQQPARPTLLEK